MCQAQSGWHSIIRAASARCRYAGSLSCCRPRPAIELHPPARAGGAVATRRATQWHSRRFDPQPRCGGACRTAARVPPLSYTRLAARAAHERASRSTPGRPDIDALSQGRLFDRKRRRARHLRRFQAQTPAPQNASPIRLLPGNAAWQATGPLRPRRGSSTHERRRSLLLRRLSSITVSALRCPCRGVCGGGTSACARPGAGNARRPRRHPRP